ncbi:DMT family transporter [Falsirhodobacter algicola]|uniref:EamA family transporter n=1 Tax=Falsirhodobacter algicola TaxID=2692330 RepID=A0A8J8MRV7_9RHOB|nr:DMT family transporter [Falsirhodobacter algicola]QUS35317.1 EamA family transporter [Falsirhodobacter algicola]
MNRAIGYMLLGIFCFTLMDATAKHLVEAGYPALQVIWARYAGQVAVIVLMLNRRFPGALRTRNPKVQVLRSVLQFGSTAFFFVALGFIGLAEATAIADTNPVLITLGAALFLGERIGLRRLLGIAATLTGALIIIRPGAEVFTPAALLPMGCAVCYAGHALATRWIGLSDPPGTSMVYSAMIGTIVTTLALPMAYTPIAMGDLWGFVAIALLGSSAQLFLLRAFSAGEASAIAPFGYAGIVLATLWGAVFFGEWPDRWTILGALVIVGAGLYVWHRETRKG